MNELYNRREYLDENDQWMEWTDVNDASLRASMQSEYFLYSPKMLDDALSICFNMKHVNPAAQELERLKWDGKPRIEECLQRWLQCDDTPYVRECSRLIFAGGVHRVYEPGCKFDDMVVLMGSQGCGKSTFVRFLAINDAYYRKINTINGKEGAESLRGVWIGEMDELMAMTRLKEVEAVKAFISAQEDVYRPAYAKYAVTLPRRCIFVGTTNNYYFLTDKTGNRRFYPVSCQSSENLLLADEEGAREYMQQCWAEALARYRQGDMPTRPDPILSRQYLEAQDAAMEDDWRVGAIEQYLEDVKKDPKARVSVIELWHNALGKPTGIDPQRSDSIEIGKIMSKMAGWRSGKTVNGKSATMRTPWGTQKYWEKDIPFLPF